MECRADHFEYALTPHHFKFLFSRFVPEVLIHSKKQDERIVREHYDRGNDFLQHSSVREWSIQADSGEDPKTETLEKCRTVRWKMVCKKLMMKPDDKYLDIGCGCGVHLLLTHLNFRSKCNRRYARSGRNRLGNTTDKG